jgi:hypothetical protein
MYTIAPLELRPVVEVPPASTGAPWAVEFGVEFGVVGFGGRFARVRVAFDRASGLVEGWQVLELAPGAAFNGA